MPSAHALLGPSSAHRWLSCPASARFEEGFPDHESKYALEGTLAHAYCARLLKQRLGEPHPEEDAEIEALRGEYWGPEMEGHAEKYADVVWNCYLTEQARHGSALLLVERRLDFSRWVPGGFGTSDAIVASDGVLRVFDFKYGKGVAVAAMGNRQMKIYALGAYAMLGAAWGFDQAAWTIVQPRLGAVSEDGQPLADLLSWAEDTLRPAAELAWRGGWAPASSGSPLWEPKREAGSWCKFCKAKEACAKWKAYSGGFHNYPNIAYF